MPAKRGHILNHFIPDYNMSFDDYLKQATCLLHEKNAQGDAIFSGQKVACNSPYELRPTNTDAICTTGALFVHGLSDSPFTLRELAAKCANNNILCRSVLLPGHGTHPEDLLTVSSQDWLKVVDYGIQSLAKDVEKIVLVGYSMGALLCLYHALKHKKMAGLVLIAPAIRIKFPADPLFRLVPYLNAARGKPFWAKKDEEIDYAKYRSVSFHAVVQLHELIQQTKRITSIHCPLYIVVSRDDETISANAAINLFKHNEVNDNKLLVYSTNARQQTTNSIIERNACFPELHIDNLSHRCMLFSKDNSHYGINGDYQLASRPVDNKYYGAYVSFLGTYYRLLHQLGLTKEIKQELTYNPDFDFMCDEIIAFISRATKTKLNR